MRFEKNQFDQILSLFFCKASSQKILAVNYEVLIMDCTYKTNKYKHPLMVITGVIALNTTFYVAFCFMSSEFSEDYA